MRLTDDEIRRLGEGDAVVRDGVLGAGVAAGISFALVELEVAPAGMGRGPARWIEPAERGDEITWLDPAASPEALAPLVAAFEQLGEQLRREVYLPVRRFDLQVARYRQPGARYARHVDALRRQVGRANRCATAIYYVNADWTPAAGGELRVFAPGGPRDLAPLCDRAVVFLSDRVPHEVLPSWRERCAVTAWYCDA